MADKIKINAGCGVHVTHDEGWVNWDKFPQSDIVTQVDLEKPWPLPDSSVDMVLFNHSLEHMGQSPDVFLGIIKELYRVCCDDAQIYINAPHPRHDEFIGDPTHVRPITPDMWVLFSKKANQHFLENNGANSLLAFQLDVDFELVQNEVVLDERFSYLQNDPTWQRMSAMNNNVVREYKLHLKVIKPSQPLDA